MVPPQLHTGTQPAPGAALPKFRATLHCPCSCQGPAGTWNTRSLEEGAEVNYSHSPPFPPSFLPPPPTHLLRNPFIPGLSLVPNGFKDRFTRGYIGQGGTRGCRSGGRTTSPRHHPGGGLATPKNGSRQRAFGAPPSIPTQLRPPCAVVPLPCAAHLQPRSGFRGSRCFLSSPRPPRLHHPLLWHRLVAPAGGRGRSLARCGGTCAAPALEAQSGATPAWHPCSPPPFSIFIHFSIIFIYFLFYFLLPRRIKHRCPVAPAHGGYF